MKHFGEVPGWSTMRKNSILSWSESLRNFIRNKQVLSRVNSYSEIALDASRIPRVICDKSIFYLSHEISDLLDMGATSQEVFTFLKLSNMAFEKKYGNLMFTQTQIDMLNKIVYKFNQINIKEKEKSKELVGSSILLYYFLVDVRMERHGISSMLLTFNSGEKIIVDTIFEEQELNLICFYKQYI